MTFKIGWTYKLWEDDIYTGQHITRESQLMFNEHEVTFEEMVRVLTKDPEKILDEIISAHKIDTIHHMIGIASEGGEILDIAKKFLIYDKEPDRAHVIEELGNLEFYMEGLRQILDITRDETIHANMKKLWKRYKGYIYSNKAAIVRADKTND